jgi:flagellar hook protein FlgE
MIGTMDTTFATAVSGLQANAVRFGTAAFNVVNSNTDGFKARAVSASDVVPGGVSTSVSQTAQSPDVAQEFVGMIQAEAGYGANAKVIDTASRMTGALLDVLA